MIVFMFSSEKGLKKVQKGFFVVLSFGSMEIWSIYQEYTL